MKLEEPCKHCEGTESGQRIHCYFCKDGTALTEEGEELLRFIQKHLVIRKYEDYGNTIEEELSRK